MQIKHVKTPKTEAPEFFSHAAAKLVPPGSFHTAVVSNKHCIARRRNNLSLGKLCACKKSNIWIQPCWKLATAQGKRVWNGWNQKRAFNEPQLFNTCFWLWSWVTLSTLKNIHNHFDMEGAEREKLSYVQPNICYFWAVGCELFLRCWKLIWELFSAGCRPCVGVCSGRWEQKPIWLSSHSAGDSCTTTRHPHIHKELIIIIVSHWAVAFAGTYSVLLDQ